MGAERTGPGEMRDPAGRVHHRELPVLRDAASSAHHPRDRVGGRCPGLEQVEQARGPSAGLVTFCEAAAPTAGRRCRHRAATAGLDELTTMPNAPVAGSRAASENVIASCSLITAVASISTSHSGRARA